jgi:hypothetical protein
VTPRLSEHSEGILELAALEALSQGSHTIEPEHILCGMLRFSGTMIWHYLDESTFLDPLGVMKGVQFQRERERRQSVILESLDLESLGVGESNRLLDALDEVIVKELEMTDAERDTDTGSRLDRHRRESETA